VWNADQDVCLATFVLEYHELLERTQGEPLLRWIVQYNNKIDVCGGVYPVDLDELVSIDRVRIDDLRRPFLNRVLIEGSGDRARWTVLLPQATMFDARAAVAADRAVVCAARIAIRATWTTPTAR
jgi:hypothetical protein